MIPIVSVVIPLYNKEKYIAKAIESVFAQTVQNFELIVVNDGSKDGGAKIVQQYHDVRLRLINQENQGVSSARNHGIFEVHSELIAFLDADDEWYPNFLETILRLHDKFPEAGMYGTAYSLYSNDIARRDNALGTKKGERLLSYYHDFVDAGYPLIITSSFAAQKFALKDVGYYCGNFGVGQDHDLFGKLALYHAVAYSPNICSQYNAGSENNVDAVRYLLRIPLEDYVKENQSELIASGYDLHLFLDFWRLKTGARNIYSGFRNEGRKQLLSVTHRQFQKKKKLFLFLSYLPISLSKISPNLIRKITNKMGLSA